MNKAETALYELLDQKRRAIKTSNYPHKTAQQVADELANLSTNGTTYKHVDVSDTYLNIIEALEDDVPSVMPKQDFIANGATDEDVKAMNASGDKYFINRNQDGTTPDFYRPIDAINRLTLIMQTVKE